ncbi:MAG: hypothetical protein O7A09_03135 [Proteobacteria bacterium]|nr:hypothetical protein [Pseudomonadota bacterium]
MDRSEVLQWLESHAGDVHGDPREIVERCEEEVRRHAAEDAWLAAKRYVLHRMHQWEHEWGFHATEAHVAREICPKLAGELRRHEPHPQPGDEEHLLGQDLLDALEPTARAKVFEWVLELADQEEHRTWEDVVRFTRGEGRALVREGRVSSDSSWEGSENYAAKAAHVAQLLAEEFEQHAHPR